ncbi:MAG: MerR family DNA-binding protein [bacterium]|nr:MerR family DNA-binding protein [bacterium]
MSTHAIRFYEKEGLLNGTHVQRSENNYRCYSTDTIERLQLIKQGRAAGFTLVEIRDLISAWQSGDMTIEEKIQIVQQKIADIDSRIHELAQTKDYLRSKLSLIQAGIA